MNNYKKVKLEKLVKLEKFANEQLQESKIRKIPRSYASAFYTVSKR